MNSITCRKCGAVFQPETKYQYICPACRREHHATSLANRICRECGVTFRGGPRAWYCPDCREERRKAKEREYKKNGPRRKIGSTDTCEICGQKYIVDGGLQRYCKKCAPEAIRQKDIDQAKEWNAENAERIKELRQKTRLCQICGKPIPPDSLKSVCSDACERIQRGKRWADFDMKRGRRKAEYGVVLNNGNPKSGIPGVTWCRGKWQVTHKGKYVGIYPTIQEAAQAKAAIEKQEENQ